MSSFLKFQFLRAIESKKLFLTLGLIALISIGGFAMTAAFYPDLDDWRIGTCSMFNAFTQFFYLVLAYVLISLFTDDAQSGANVLFRYMGYGGIKVVLSKMLYCLVIFLPITDLIMIVSAVAYGCDDFEYIGRLVLLLDISIIQVIMIASTISSFFKKTSTATILMYGNYLFFDIVNLLGYGVTNQADGNSMTSYYVSVVSGCPMNQPSWKAIGDYSNDQLFMFSILLNIFWILLLFITTLIKAKRMK